MLAAAATFLAVVVASSLLSGKKTKLPLPPGSFGLPIIGQTLSYHRALNANAGEDWFRRWITTYGPVSRLSYFNTPTAILAGPSGNKFIFSSASVTAKTTASMARMIGRRTLQDVVGDEHRRVRTLILRFLQPDACKRYVAGMDAEVRRHLDAQWKGRTTVAVMPAMKDLTFDVMCTALFSLERDGGENDAVRQVLSTEFQQLVKGISVVPLNLPFTSFSKCLAASRRGRRALRDHRGEAGKARERAELADRRCAHDTTAALLTFLIRYLDANRDAYEKLVHEQEEIAQCKAPDEALSWEDLSKMRHTWAAAQETLRLIPPVFSILRETTDDIEFAGYRIPKGWQLLQPTSTTHWDPKIFPEPEMFDPARFMDASAVPPFCFIPFGGGPRMCPGNEFGRVETLVAMHYIVTRFRWKLAPSCDGSYARFPLPYPSQGFLIDIQPRHRQQTNA
ncbi:hypothetical protein PR202_gb25442 [Eleusine coracana subsp. coracana]|uniref:Cytochrome P450 n=1 Tax=Eleusine coracana subsp. coracana TaxID=191504 RepID=A0AAV5FL75_ELECO|nr:hypothetical protein PR202_gb25442 [Eleusine coracana subsp. coracana]